MKHCTPLPKFIVKKQSLVEYSTTPTLLCLVAQSCPTLCNPTDCSPPRVLCPWDSPGKNPGVGCMPSSRDSSQPRNRTQVSRNAGRFFTVWVTREALHSSLLKKGFSRNVKKHIKKQRYYFTDIGLSSQSYGFSNTLVWMWELDYKESWALKSWCYWTVVLEKTLQSPLDCKEIETSPS